MADQPTFFHLSFKRPQLDLWFLGTLLENWHVLTRNLSAFVQNLHLMTSHPGNPLLEIRWSISDFHHGRAGWWVNYPPGVFLLFALSELRVEKCNSSRRCRYSDLWCISSTSCFGSTKTVLSDFFFKSHCVCSPVWFWGVWQTPLSAVRDLSLWDLPLPVSLKSAWSPLVAIALQWRHLFRILAPAAWAPAMTAASTPPRSAKKHWSASCAHNLTMADQPILFHLSFKRPQVDSWFHGALLG